MLSPEEEAGLREIVEKDPQARWMMESQTGTTELLEDLSSVEPPPHLKERTLNGIDPQRYAPQASLKAARRTESVFRPRFGPRMGLRLGVTFAVGLIVGGIVPILLNTERSRLTEMEARDFIGTIGLHESEHFSEMERLPVRGERLQGEMVFRTLGELVGCEIRLDTGEACVLILEYAPEVFSFYGFQPSDRTEIELEHAEGSIRTLNSDRVRYVIFLRKHRPNGAILHLTLNRSGMRVFKKDIVFGDNTADR